MRLFLITLILLPNVSFSKDCFFELDKESLKIGWTAFKTPLKVGVKGSFDDIGVDKSSKATSFSKMLTGIPFNIQTKTVNTADPARDKKIHTFFFKTMKSGDKISGKVISYQKKVLNISITMNGKELMVPLKVNQGTKEFTAEGHIDILDFAMSSNLAALNKACSELHQGKTWSDIDVTLSGNYLKSCK